MTRDAVELLRKADYFRRPFTPMASEAPRKEWQHFVLHTEGLRLIVNYSVNDRVTTAGLRFDPRTIVIATHDDGTTAMIERADPSQTVTRAASVDAELGPNRMHTTDEGYIASFGHRDSAISGILRFEPDSLPFVVNNQAITAEARLSWLFVPRLRASGHVRVGDRRFVIEEAPAYHDHNWGSFRWGDDFGWEWACFLPTDASNPWTAVYMRIIDARAMETRGQALYVWHGRDPVGLWRNRQIKVDQFGVMRQPPESVMPPIAKLLRQGRRCDIPAKVALSTTGSKHNIELEYSPNRYSQVVLPDEVKGAGTVVLNETHGPAHLRITDESGVTHDVDFEGTYEYVRS